MALAAPVQTPDPEIVLCKALFNVQQALGLNQAELGRVIGMDRTSVGRLRARARLSPSSKTGELAACLIRLYRSLFALTGGDPAAMRHWLATPNRHLQATPGQLIVQVEGLVRVLHYLDALRGKV